MTGCATDSLTLATMMRAVTSALPPAGKGRIRRSGFEGNPCPSADDVNATAHTNPSLWNQPITVSSVHLRNVCCPGNARHQFDLLPDLCREFLGGFAGERLKADLDGARAALGG